MPRVILEQAIRLQTSTGLRDHLLRYGRPGGCLSIYPVVSCTLKQARVAAWTENAALTLDPGGCCRATQVFHTPHSAVPDEVRQHPRVSVIQTVYDMIPFLLPETMTAEYREYYADIIRRICPGDHVITISRSAKADFCDHTGFAEDRVHVVPLAANEDLFRPCHDPAHIATVRAKHGIPEGPYLLSVCTFEPRKNLRHLVRSFVELLRAHPEVSDLTLVLTGGQGWMFGPILAELAGTALPNGRIITTGYVPDADLAPLYSGASAFLYLSRYEGFGLPPLEAMQCGTPVIVSNTSSLPEVVGEAGILLSPDDRDGLCQAILDLHAHPGQRARLAEKSIGQARQFSWEKNVRQTTGIYRLAAG